MAPRSLRRIGGLACYVLGFLVLLTAALQLIVALLARADAARPLLFGAGGVLLVLAAGWAFRSAALPAEVLLTSTAFAALLSGVLLLFRLMAGRPTAGLTVTLALAAGGAVGLYAARRIARRRVRASQPKASA